MTELCSSCGEPIRIGGDDDGNITYQHLAKIDGRWQLHRPEPEPIGASDADEGAESAEGEVQ
jgi:hypothetical protein